MGCGCNKKNKSNPSITTTRTVDTDGTTTITTFENGNMKTITIPASDVDVQK